MSAVFHHVWNINFSCVHKILLCTSDWQLIECFTFSLLCSTCKKNYTIKPRVVLPDHYVKGKLHTCVFHNCLIWVTFWNVLSVDVLLAGITLQLRECRNITYICWYFYMWLLLSLKKVLFHTKLSDTIMNIRLAYFAIFCKKWVYIVYYPVFNDLLLME